MPRIDALIARNLGLSRKQVRRLIRARRIHDDHGEAIDDPRQSITPSSGPRQIEIDGQHHVLHHRFGLILHKPLGFVTALRDARHPTAYALVRDAPLSRDLRAVGRLDKDTSGLLLWTTDGTLLHKLTHPRYAVPRTYHVALSDPWLSPPEDLVLDDGHRPRIVELDRLDRDRAHPGLIVPPSATALATITVTTGRFHEVRRIFAALDTNVVALCRVRYGPVSLPTDLAAGTWHPTDLHATFRDLCPA